MTTITRGVSTPTLAFHDTHFIPLPKDGQQWLLAADIARALGYSREDAISRIYNRNSGEFTDSMTLTVKLTVKGFGSGNSEKDVRIFSLRGAHLVAMFARSPRAAEFRRWVLDILDKETAAPVPAVQSAISKYRYLTVITPDASQPPVMIPMKADAFVMTIDELCSALSDPTFGTRDQVSKLALVAVSRLASCAPQAKRLEA